MRSQTLLSDCRRRGLVYHPGTKCQGRPSNKPDSTNASHLGFEATLWVTADKLRGDRDASAMIAIERDKPSLKGVLPKEYARPHLDNQSLGGVIDFDWDD